MNPRYQLIAWMVFVFLVSLFCTPLQAGIGVKAGPMLSKMVVDHYGASNHKSAPGYRGSVFYSIPLLKTTTLEPGLSFAGESFQYYYVPARNYTNARVNFLKLNLLVNVRLAPTRFHFMAGPYAAVRLGDEDDGDSQQDIFKAENKTGWGVQMGCRFYFNKSNGRHTGLFTEILGDIGLTKFQNEIGVFKTTYYQSLHISILIGYAL